MNYQIKPIRVKAIQFLESHLPEVETFLGDRPGALIESSRMGLSGSDYYLIVGDEPEMGARLNPLYEGDWIVLRGEKTFSVVSDIDFEANYEPEPVG